MGMTKEELEISGKIAAIQASVHALLTAIGEDPNRDGLKETPNRVAKSFLNELCSGYKIDPTTLFKTFEPDGYQGIILVKDIPLTSLCEHHLLVFSGHCHVAYIPNGKVIGLSKIARVVDVFARRLQVQERLTNQIADCLMQGLDAKGVLVIIAAEHSCMAIRGVAKVGAVTVTAEIRGIFATDPSVKNEAYQLLKEDIKR